VMFGLALGAWGYLRLVQTGRRRFLALALLGLTFAMHADWAAFVFVALVLAAGLLRMLLRRFTPPLPLRAYAVFWCAAACLAVASGGFYLVAFNQLGQIEQFLRQGQHRATGSALPLSEVLETRRFWIETTFTPLAIWLGKAGAALLVVRTLVVRADGEWLPLCVLLMATFQYVVFKNGADVHIYWPHYFALYFALALGALAQTLESGFDLVARVAKREWLRSAAPLAALAGAALVCLAILPDGVRAWVFARKTGGRFNERGSIIHPDIDKQKALEFVARLLPQNAPVVLHPGIKHSYWLDWVLERPLAVRALSRNASQDRYYLIDPRFAEPEELEPLLEHDVVSVVGPIWFVERGTHGAARAFRVVPREPSEQRLGLRRGAHAPREIEADPWAGWELAHHLQGSAPVPAVAPKTFEELRAAHNQALAAGDTAKAEALLARLLNGADRRPRCRYSDGSELLAARFEPSE